MKNRLIQLICNFDRAVKTLYSKAHPAPKREYPAESIQETIFEGTEQQRLKSCYEMRINHTGEVCAQALYDGHYLLSSCELESQKKWLKEARDEEVDHLLWCHRRLTEIGGYPSRLNPIFYTMSYVMARTLSSINPTWNMQFIRETESQVFEHLQRQEEMLSFDARSMAIIGQMKKDEKEHEETAASFEKKPLPFIAKKSMAITAAMMKFLVRWV